MSECDHPWTSEDGCWICDLEEIIDRQKETISAVTAERDALANRLKYFGDCEYQAEPRGAFGMGGGWCAKHERYWNDCRPTPWDVEELRAELSELRARVERAKVFAKSVIEDYENDTSHLLAVLEGDEKSERANLVEEIMRKADILSDEGSPERAASMYDVGKYILTGSWEW